MRKFIEKHRQLIKPLATLVASLCLILGAMILFWVSTFKVPTLTSIRERRVTESTKIYDRTGQILLYDTGGNVRRSSIPIEEISRNIKNATLAIEDKKFYEHHGVEPLSIIRAFLANIMTLSWSQGGSTITQQVVKNSILTGNKDISRKLKELVLAVKLEQMVTKDEILSMYLNEIPYGGNIYGVEEASQAFFGKSSRDVDLTEAAYLASLPKAPSYYSPYGKNKDKLEERKNLVLKEMLSNNFITKDEYDIAMKEKVNFIAKGDMSVKAPHFVFYVLDYLKNKYGDDALQSEGFRVITSLDYDLQSIGEKIAKDYALQNKINFNAENAAIVAIDPRTGEILTMVGSRDYFDKEIDGAFNVTTARRQPGSTIKPFVYSEAFIKGYTPETVLFDVPTQFNSGCDAKDFTMENGCYAPTDYDGLFRGPMTLRNALAQSINIPSVKVLYLAGLSDSIRLARDMGLESLSNKGDYGLTLVLGGGEVTPLQMVSGYGVFANSGIKTNISPIIEIKNKNGETIETHNPNPSQVLDKEITLKISSILSDNIARTPAYGQTSALYFPNRDVAVKTGTTNDYRDAWIMGYTPSIAVGAWAGNNDNSPMVKKVAGLIVAPMWRAFMDQALAKLPDEQFEEPLVEDKATLKPVLQGIWQGGIFQQNSGNQNSGQQIVTGGVHSILYWLDKSNPRGLPPLDSNSDSLFKNWESSVRAWAQDNGMINDNPVVVQ
jgi:1A family penicillin-binding protein